MLDIERVKQGVAILSPEWVRFQEGGKPIDKADLESERPASEAGRPRERDEGRLSILGINRPLLT